MNIAAPTIDVILEAFFLEQGITASPMRQRRLKSLEFRLCDYLEVEGERILVTADLELLASERQFDPEGAFRRTMHADDLLFALPGFLERCVPADLTDGRLHVATIGALASWLITRRLIDQAGLECILLDVDAALRRGKADLRVRRAAARART
jgi:hypothetical protein